MTKEVDTLFEFGPHKAVGSAYHDWNDGAEKDGTVRLHAGGRFYHGVLPQVGDVVRIVDPDASCGECYAVVERLREADQVTFAYARVFTEMRYWSDMDAPTTTGGGPDWLMWTYDAMRGGPD